MMLSAARYCSVAALRASGRTTRIASSPLRAVPGFRPPARRTRKMGTGGGASLLCVSAAEASTSKKGGGVGAAPAYPPLRVTAPGRVVALGDIHGDIGQARRALSIAGVLGAGGDAVNPEWVGGNTTVVQVGDVLDRGDDEIAILILLQKLHKQAEKQGGAVYILNGNHEVLNVSGDFRYVTQGAFQESMRFGEHLVNLFGKAFEDAFGGAEEDARKKTGQGADRPLLPRRPTRAAVGHELHSAYRQRYGVCARGTAATARGIWAGASEQLGVRLDAGEGNHRRERPHSAWHGHRKRQRQRGVESYVWHGEFHDRGRSGAGVCDPGADVGCYRRGQTACGWPYSTDGRMQQPVRRAHMAHRRWHVLWRGWRRSRGAGDRR
mmetsp:Transcript_25264/g.63256  ORF Transcript_25264/g.63256 Transcript_25264/m.63256 type:complete len:380 (-) Transcript_25264:507-1646(-)